MYRTAKMHEEVYDPDGDGIIALAQLDALVMSAPEHSVDPHTMSIDGRDVSVDGAKLDGIEAGATADQTGLEIVSLLEALAGLEVRRSSVGLHLGTT